MGFKQSEVEHLLVSCGRRCCVCYRFCGVKIELDHIVPQSEGGDDDINNAIPVCFDCHAEIHSYNDQHPRGRKYRPGELKGHKEKWLAICEQRPEVLAGAPREVHVGPLQAMIDELMVDLDISRHAGMNMPRDFSVRHVLPLMDDQFQRAIAQGAIATLDESCRHAVVTAYTSIGRAKMLSRANVFESAKDTANSGVGGQLTEMIKALTREIEAALQRLTSFLS